MVKLWCYLLIIVSVGCASSEDKRIEPAEGEVSTQRLFTEYPSFKQIFEAYQPSQQEISAVQNLTGKSLIVLFGTWCHDSEREIPRLLKLLEVSQVKLKALSLRALNYSKQDPSGLHHTYNLESTPTIILLDGEQELGRIVEAPRVSLGQDLAGFIIH
jgi:hypothetical protein